MQTWVAQLVLLSVAGSRTYRYYNPHTCEGKPYVFLWPSADVKLVFSFACSTTVCRWIDAHPTPAFGYMLSVQTSKSSLEAAWNIEASNIPTHFYVPISREKGGGSAHPRMSFSPPFPCYSSSCAPKLQAPFLIHDLFYNFYNYWSPPTHSSYIQVRSEDEWRFFLNCVYFYLRMGVFTWVRDHGDQRAHI